MSFFQKLRDRVSQKTETVTSKFPARVDEDEPIVCRKSGSTCDGAPQN